MASIKGASTQRGRKAKGARVQARSRTFGYARVSTAEQNLDRQLDALAEFGVRQRYVFADKASGKDFERPEWQRMLSMLRAGDVLVVSSIDRLGRNYAEVLDQWRELTKLLGVQIVVLDMPLLDTRGGGVGGLTGELIADIVLQLLSYVAQVERENIHKRQEEGIRAAKLRGVHMGRPPKRRPQAWREVRDDYLAGTTTRLAAAERLKCSVTTFDKWLREDEGPE